MAGGSARQSDADILFQQALSAMENAQPEIAVNIFKKLVTHHRGRTDILFPYAIALYQTGAIDDAIKHLKTVFSKEPTNGDAAYNLGLIAQEAGDLKTSEKAFIRAAKITPSKPEYHIMLGNILTERGKLTTSVASFTKALQLDRKKAEAWYGLALVLRKLDNVDGAHNAAIEALNIDPSHIDARIILVAALHYYGKTDQAIAHLQKILVMTPDDVQVHNNLSQLAMIIGETEIAITYLRRAIALQNDYATAHYNLSRLVRFKPGDSDFKNLEAAALQNDHVPDQHIYSYALSKAYQDIGDHDKAFSYMHLGATQKRKEISYDPKHIAKYVDRIINTFDRNFAASGSQIPNSDKTIIFILGMTRSGTTLIEQILTSHSQVTGGGELSFLLEIAENTKYPARYKNASAAFYTKLGNFYMSATARKSEGSLFFTDKTPGNFIHIGLILAALPNAKIIHCRRDPVDTCLSCYKQLFNKGVLYSFDLIELGQYYLQYIRLMEHWHKIAPDRIFNIDYEAVINDTETQVQRLLDYCGLPFEESCLRFYENKRPVNTASTEQVRKPIYKSSVDLWRNYEEHLQPLLEILKPIRPGTL